MANSIEFQVSTVGLVIPFVITENNFPVSNALSATVVWHSSTGIRRQLTLVSPASAEWNWITSAHDFRTPRTEEGYLSVSYAQNVFYSSSFQVRVSPHLG